MEASLRYLVDHQEMIIFNNWKEASLAPVSRIKSNSYCPSIPVSYLYIMEHVIASNIMSHFGINPYLLSPVCPTWTPL